MLLKSAVREFWASCCPNAGNLYSFGQSQWCRPVALANSDCALTVNVLHVGALRWDHDVRPAGDWGLHTWKNYNSVPFHCKSVEDCRSIHLGSTNIDPDPLVSLGCYLANQWSWDLLAQPKWCLLSSLHDLSRGGSAFRASAMPMSRPGITKALPSLMRRGRVSTSSTLLDRTNFTLSSCLERVATTFSANGLIADEAESPYRNRERIISFF